MQILGAIQMLNVNLNLDRVNQHRLMLQGPILPVASSQFLRYFLIRKFARRSGNSLKMKRRLGPGFRIAQGWSKRQEFGAYQ